MNIDNDSVLRLFHLAHARKLSLHDIEVMCNYADNIDEHDPSIFTLIEGIGYLLAFCAEFDGRSLLFERLIKWAHSKGCPALAGTALRTLVVKCDWQAPEAADLIISFLCESDWDEGFEAVDSAIDAARSYKVNLPPDPRISACLKNLLESKTTPKLTKKHIRDECGRYLST